MLLSDALNMRDMFYHVVLTNCSLQSFIIQIAFAYVFLENVHITFMYLFACFCYFLFHDVSKCILAKGIGRKILGCCSVVLIILSGVSLK